MFVNFAAEIEKWAPAAGVGAQSEDNREQGPDVGSAPIENIGHKPSCEQWPERGAAEE